MIKNFLRYLPLNKNHQPHVVNNITPGGDDSPYQMEAGKNRINVEENSTIHFDLSRLDSSVLLQLDPEDSSSIKFSTVDYKNFLDGLHENLKFYTNKNAFEFLEKNNETRNTLSQLLAKHVTHAAAAPVLDTIFNMMNRYSSADTKIIETEKKLPGDSLLLDKVFPELEQMYRDLHESSLKIDSLNKAIDQHKKNINIINTELKYNHDLQKATQKIYTETEQKAKTLDSHELQGELRSLEKIMEAITAVKYRIYSSMEDLKSPPDTPIDSTTINAKIKALEQEIKNISYIRTNKSKKEIRKAIDHIIKNKIPCSDILVLKLALLAHKLKDLALNKNFLKYKLFIISNPSEIRNLLLATMRK
ncbi:hypothetical protein [Paraburkholderia hayleyella]|uniref:hypothetical protein n=1 Tax=Paraburkholderia hayleyella TaxID=2152889 RepID=UPI00129285AE|nr:hypothetical protein [Paraburkholderia hayleyella]